MSITAANTNHKALGQLEDKELLELFQEGNQLAFEELINRHKPKILSTIMHVVKDREVAEDLFQDTLIKILDTLRTGKYDEKGKFLPWALRVARNLAIDYFRRDKRNPQVNAGDNSALLENLYQTADSMEREMIRTEHHTMVRHLIRRLPPKQREVLIMRHYNNMSFKEIAELTDVSINTALGRMRYAMNNLRKLAEQHGYNL